MITVMVLEPCCEKTEPGYDPGPRPVWNRTPGGWPPRCNHRYEREVKVTQHETRESADREFAKTRGWRPTDGWLFEGEMPPEGERFRIMPIVGGGGSGFHRHAEPWDIPFPTVGMAQTYAERFSKYPDGRSHRYHLYHVVGDQDTRVRWSATGVPEGTVLHAGDPA